MKILCSYLLETLIWKGEGRYSSYLKKSGSTNSNDSLFYKIWYKTYIQ